MDPVLHYNEIGDFFMKSLRVYFVMALVWLCAGLSLVACSKKDKSGSGGTCQPGYIMQNGSCVYTGNGGNGGGYGTTPGSGIMYGKNGQISNMDQFRDFNLRVSSPYMSAYYCLGGGYIYQIYFDCSHAYVALLRNGTSYYVQISSPSITNQSVYLSAAKFGGSNANQSIFEVYYSNPQPYKIGELVITGNLDTATSVSYIFNYYRNTGDIRQIISGTMRKGFDY